MFVYAIYIKYMYLCAFNNKHTNMRFLFYISEIVSCIYMIRQYFTFPNSSISILLFLNWLICYVCGHMLALALTFRSKTTWNISFSFLHYVTSGVNFRSSSLAALLLLSHPSGLILFFCREYVITLLTENAHKGSARLNLHCSSAAATVDAWLP